ncbi:seven-hairpin glycosidase [Paraphaeosphaeria sporulosa]|uniref:alpha-1,2-Mannosidase n=1 Tax=Paraphaeosphaeria sporulosa TaxID=1460663 RepID=A0A177C0Z5_9PLEO|nr:seven-hairpin glycosidase [Paraphaeosphaeria sporulosa]OAG01313.1 seven-hairpin glycosidase [Paraphaeosphaeria sporulosa]
MSISPTYNLELRLHIIKKMPPKATEIIPLLSCRESSPPSLERNRSEPQWRTNGFWSTHPHYKGRPEYVESLFYAHRITGEARFREWAWDAFTAMERYCKAPYGYAQLAGVYRVDPGQWSSESGGRWIDMHESFWAAETLRYLWLAFSDANIASLNR